MTLGITFKVKSYLRPGAAKKRSKPGSSNSSERDVAHGKLDVSDVIPSPMEEAVSVDQQLRSLFFQKLPPEIRQAIYAYVWPGPHDHRYHSPDGRHIHFKDGRWSLRRCVMYKEDEDLDFIQKQMDRCYDPRQDTLLLWQKRLASTWGVRHWRCEERVEYGQKPARIDYTDLPSLMLVCKRMYPEAMGSFFESHTIIFNDLFAAHRFFLNQPSPFATQIRHLDVSLVLPFHECSPFVVERPRSRVKELLYALRRIRCLHTLRLAFDIYDFGPWRKLPEQAIAKHLDGLRVLKKFVVELPPSLPIKTPAFNMRSIGGEAGIPFEVVRRSPMRYWQFYPGEVEHFRWDTQEKGDQKHCWITLSKAGRAIPNPYLIDFSGRMWP
ncbi:hypothetical protein F4780DRAFT_782894 [Xylariomycetidae sp. FL0641]|nr:hypothetical protein F4780DRAFT_782894 [Xylariomycetidae sp. FL0641]